MDAIDLASAAVQHIRKMPYWDRRAGVDHMFIFTTGLSFLDVLVTHAMI